MIRPPEIYTREEIRDLIAACNPRCPTGARNRALITLGYRGGLRCAEALSLHPHDLSTETGELYVRRGKGGKPRRVAIDQDACAIVAAWMQIRATLPSVTPRSPLLCTLTGGKLSAAYVRATMTRLGHRAGILKRVHFHGLRHTYACEMAREATVPEVQRLLGHSSLATTAIYLDHIAPHQLTELIRNRAPWATT